MRDQNLFVEKKANASTYDITNITISEDFDKDFPNGTKGEYETITNNRALAAIEQSLQESTETSYKLDGSNLRLLESELDVHTLSVVFPAAINADGTVKTGEAANAAIKKLGKFLKVCG